MVKTSGLKNEYRYVEEGRISKIEKEKCVIHLWKLPADAGENCETRLKPRIQCSSQTKYFINSCKSKDK